MNARPGGLRSDQHGDPPGGSGSAGRAVETAIARLGAGEMVVLADAEDSGAAPDLVLAAAHATPRTVAFMLAHTSGILCVPMPAGDLDRLLLPPMVAVTEDRGGVDFAVSVTARTGTTSGISAADRARTISMLADPETGPAQLSRPGHVFPLRTAEGGVLRRAGHAEAAVDMTRLSGLAPVAVTGGLVDDDGVVLRGDRLRRFAATHGLAVVTVADLIAHRQRCERLVELRASTRLPTRYGEFRAHGFRSLLDGGEHVALVMGDPTAAGAGTHGAPPLVRLHPECVIGNALGSVGCDCGSRLHRALRMVAGEGRGAVIYLRGQQARSLGLVRGYPRPGGPVPHAGAAGPSPRCPSSEVTDHGIGAQMLADLGVRAMRLLTDSPVERIGLAAYGLQVAGSVSLGPWPTPARAGS